MRLNRRAARQQVLGQQATETVHQISRVCQPSPPERAVLPIEFRSGGVSKLVSTPGSIAKRMGLSGSVRVRGASEPDSNRPASPFRHRNEPQSGDFPTLPQLLTSLVGGLFWLGLAFGFVVLLGLQVGAI